MAVTWSDGDSGSEYEEEAAKLVTALSGTCNSDNDSSDEEVTFEELADTYKKLCIRSGEVCQQNEKQKKLIEKLEAEKKENTVTISHLNSEIIVLNSKLDQMTKSVKMLTTGTDKLEEILQLGQNAGNKHGLGYVAENKPVSDMKKKRHGKPMSKQLSQHKTGNVSGSGYEAAKKSASDKKKNRSGKSMSKKISQHKAGNRSGSGYVEAKKFADNKKKNRPNKPMSKQMSQHWGQHQDQRNMNKNFQRWRCHYCGRFGHIKPFCYRLHGYPNQTPYVKNKNIKVPYTQKWKKKNAALIAHTSLRVSAKEDWYFDSGCSKHMTGIKNLLNEVRLHTTSYVTFGDGAKGEIKGVGNLDYPGVPNLNEVLLVKGLTANLISISQLCDSGFKVNFTKSECIVTNEKQEIVMRGVRSKDNCYLWEPENTNLSTVCSTVKDEKEVKLWHQKLGHLHLRGMKKIISMEAVRGIPRLDIDEGRVCGECQVGKQTRVSHPMLRHLTTSKVLELLHMDLMGPMQVESLGGKRYAYVVVDDFSRFTWINFIKEKSDVFDVFKELCKRLQREKESCIVRIRSDHGKEFENSKFDEFCSSEGINHEFSSPITP